MVRMTPTPEFMKEATQENDLVKDGYQFYEKPDFHYWKYDLNHVNHKPVKEIQSEPKRKKTKRQLPGKKLF